MNRKGQIFLLLTLLVITFISGISTTLIDLQQAQYNDPSPQTTPFLQVWESSLEVVETILINAMAERSAGNILTDGEHDTYIQEAFTNYSSYLLSRGYSPALSAVAINATNYLETNTGALIEFEYVNFQISLSLSTPDLSLNQEVAFNILYHAEAASGTITLYKIIQGERSPISDITVQTAAGALSGGYNGEFSYTVAGPYTLLTLLGVEFDLTAP